MTSNFCLSSYSRIVTVMFIKSSKCYSWPPSCAYKLYIIFWKANFVSHMWLPTCLMAVPAIDPWLYWWTCCRSFKKCDIFLFIELSISKRASIYRISCVNCAPRSRYWRWVRSRVNWTNCMTSRCDLVRPSTRHYARWVHFHVHGLVNRFLIYQ